MDSVIKLHFVDRPTVVRLLEIFPGLMSWLFLLTPVLLSLTYPVVVAYFIIAFDLYWLIKSLRLSYFLIRGYRRLHKNQAVDWEKKLDTIEHLEEALISTEEQIDDLIKKYPSIIRKWFQSPKAALKRPLYQQKIVELKELQDLTDRRATIINPKDLINVVIIATYNESVKILKPTIEAVLSTNYNHKQIWLVIAYEERGGSEIANNAKSLAKVYGQEFGKALAIEHPDNLPGEFKGKGANITYAGRVIAKLVDEQKINPENVIITTLDSDNRPGKAYFASLSYIYATNVNRIRKSYQPVAMFLNNIWDAPAPMRVIATGNSFWNIVESVRPHRLRNFAAQSQSLQTLLDTDFWSVTSIVEDGHQYWRTYFAYDGDHQVVPLPTPVYQDAVLAEGYLRTFKVQYLQLRRWACGVTDFPYVVRNAVKNNRIPWSDKLLQIGRLFEGHFSWATAPLIITFVAWLPLFLNRSFSESVLAHQLPIIAGWIMTIALVGLFITIWISIISLPPKPPRYRKTRVVGMLMQWLLMPVTTILFSATAALDAQTRMMIGKSLAFMVTEKATKE